MECTLYIDGGARGNPGPAAAGIVIRNGDTGKSLVEAGYFLGRATNNVAEYKALLRGLELASELHAECIDIHSDSELVVKQITGEYRVKSADLQPLFQQVQRQLLKLDSWRIRHIPREQNKRADELANQAMDAGRDVAALGGNQIPSDPETNEQTSSLPAFTAEIGGKRGQCIAGCAPGNAYTFGATTPEGFCTYAAAAALSEGPLQWPVSQQSGQTRCQRCNAPIHLNQLT